MNEKRSNFTVHKDIFWLLSLCGDKTGFLGGARVERQRPYSITAGGQKAVLNWFEWNLLPNATH